MSKPNRRKQRRAEARERRAAYATEVKAKQEATVRTYRPTRLAVGTTAPAMVLASLFGGGMGR